MSSPTSPRNVLDTVDEWTDLLTQHFNDARRIHDARIAHGRMLTAINHARLQDNFASDLRIAELEAELRDLQAELRNLQAEFNNEHELRTAQTILFALERIALQAARDDIATLKQTLNREGIWESLHKRIEQLEAENEQLQAANEQLKAANDALNVKFNCPRI